MGKSVNNFQQSLDLLKQYYKWDLEVNILKTKTMVFRKRGDIYKMKSGILIANCHKLLTI